MKHILILFFFTISFNSFSQNWELNDIDKTKEYGFQYTFSFQNENDKNEFKVSEKKNSKRTELKGQIFDKLNNPISGVYIKIISKNKTLSKQIQADFEGNFKTELPTGEYSIEINYVGYDQFKTDFRIKENSTTEFKIKLGLGQELRIYQIDSKTELTDNEISEIIDCVNGKRKSKSFSTTECSEKNKYNVTIQI
ncbi:carboxypeptidase regulatory-like domain-containing protein [Polaribacter haliotis]|uniref:Carboxypeptidase regulatory-like domain-containing protein n=1 Tax=Polaribacter haliotis TaxID=1888915 RepID=A0A7L8ABQ6_9FLAO|nr:carboxypeptidase-like regulatory domain-containing protein [Polaribacter haliotis]QOD59430.1 carboxypeptidase regulatory-like domain-containing protein [Polaribacter haliotis]